MAAEENKAILRNWVDQAWNKGNYSLATEVLSPSYKLNDPSAHGTSTGPESFKQFVSQYRTAIPDLTLKIEDMVAEGNKVVWRWHASGTHKGKLMGISPTGSHVELSGIVFSRFEKGKLVEDFSNWDTLGLLQQIGVVSEELVS